MYSVLEVFLLNDTLIIFVQIIIIIIIITAAHLVWVFVIV